MVEAIKKLAEEVLRAVLRHLLNLAVDMLFSGGRRGTSRSPASA